MAQQEVEFHLSRKRIRYVVYLIVLASACMLKAAPEDSAKIDAIFAGAGLKAGKDPGAAVLVLENGQVVFERAYGVAELRSLDRIDARTNFRLASLSKQFTALAIMLLVHDGKLRYEDRLTDIFPEFPAYGREITIRHLLNHTSGLADYEDLMAPVDPRLAVEQVQIQDAGVLDLLKKQNQTKFTPGTDWAYSNSGYVVLGLIVQKISGKSFPDFLRERIFMPLEMTSTVAYVRGKNSISNRSFGHTLENGKWNETDQSPTSATLGDGGIYSSLEDLTKWDRALHRHTLLSEEEMKAALTPVKVSQGKVTGPDGKPAAYGFGWFLNPYHNHARAWHYGETVGFRSAIQRFAERDLTIIILANRADLNPTELALKVADVLLDSGRCAPGDNLSRVLRCMDDASDHFRQAQANVELVQYTAVVKEKDVQTGQIFFRRKDRETDVALWIQKPHPKQAVVKGDKLTFYDPSTKQVSKRTLGDNKSDVEAVMNLGFGGRGEDMLKEYDVTLAGWEKIDGIDTARLDLVAKSERLRRLFSKLVLWIDPARDVALQQQRFEASGDYQLTHYTSISMSSKISDDKFVVGK